MTRADSRAAGRPTKTDSRARTARFLQLAAAGVPLDEAARQAGVKAERALRLVSDRQQFDAAVAAICEAA